MTQEQGHLRTKFVFIDTEAYKKEGFDWIGPKLAKLLEFSKDGHVVLLTTGITKSEVHAKLEEKLHEAQSTISKHRVILSQSGFSNVVTAVNDQSKMMGVINAEFEKFLNNSKTIIVPLDADLNSLFGDYFSAKPPFSRKKKDEFPDAVVLGSLVNWCKKHGNAMYVVSGDPDFEAYCQQDVPLYYAPSIADIISQATVSKKLHDGLAGVLFNSTALKEELGDHLRGNSIERVRGYGRYQGITADGYVQAVSDVNVYDLNVLEHDGKRFVCEIEFEANLDLEIEVEEITGGGDGPDYAWSRTDVSTNHVFTAEVIVKFDLTKPEEVEIESVHVSGKNIELDAEDIIKFVRS